MVCAGCEDAVVLVGAVVVVELEDVVVVRPLLVVVVSPGAVVDVVDLPGTVVDPPGAVVGGREEVVEAVEVVETEGGVAGGIVVSSGWSDSSSGDAVNSGCAGRPATTGLIASAQILAGNVPPNTVRPWMSLIETWRSG